MGRSSASNVVAFFALVVSMIMFRRHHWKQRQRQQEFEHETERIQEATMTELNKIKDILNRHQHE